MLYLNKSNIVSSYLNAEGQTFKKRFPDVVRLSHSQDKEVVTYKNVSGTLIAELTLYYLAGVKQSLYRAF